MAAIPPYYPALANVFTKDQTIAAVAATLLLAPTTGGPAYINTSSGAGVCVQIRRVGVCVMTTSGIETYNATGSPIAKIGATPSSSSIAPASGTVYQPSTSRYAVIRLSVYATTAGTAGTITIARGASSTPPAEPGTYISGSTSSTACVRVEFSVPPSWYWSATLSGVTIESATQILE